jgi:hypothetical protein
VDHHSSAVGAPGRVGIEDHRQAREVAIVRATLPAAEQVLGEQAVAFVQGLRREDLAKTPGIAETLDWAMALSALHIDHLDKTIIEQTLGVVIKEWNDTRQVQLSLGELLERTGIHSKIEEVGSKK